MTKTLALALIIALVAIATYLILPMVVGAIGLHPDYVGPRFTAKGKRALIITTSHATLGPDGKKTGVFGSEMTAPYYEFHDAGMEVDVVRTSVRRSGSPLRVEASL